MRISKTNPCECGATSMYHCDCPLPVCAFCKRCVLVGVCCQEALDAAIEAQKEEESEKL